MIYVAIGIGAALGANARYLLELFMVQHVGADFPYGTLLINVSGSLLIGFFLTLISGGVQIDPIWRLFFVTGFLGGYTTFSAYSFEVWGLLRLGHYNLSLLYAVGSAVGGLLAVMLGIALATLIRRA